MLRDDARRRRARRRRARRPCRRSRRRATGASACWPRRRPSPAAPTSEAIARRRPARRRSSASPAPTSRRSSRAASRSTSASSRPCARYCAPLREAGVDTVILGCTHYPLVAPMLQRDARARRRRSSPPARRWRARSSTRSARARPAQPARRARATTASCAPATSTAFRALGTRFLQMPLGEVEHVDLARRGRGVTRAATRERSYGRARRRAAPDRRSSRASCAPRPARR